MSAVTAAGGRRNYRLRRGLTELAALAFGAYAVRYPLTDHYLKRE